MRNLRGPDLTNAFNFKLEISSFTYFYDVLLHGQFSLSREYLILTGSGSRGGALLSGTSDELTKLTYARMRSGSFDAFRLLKPSKYRQSLVG